MRIAQKMILITQPNRRTRWISLHGVISAEMLITWRTNAGRVRVIDVELPVIELDSVKQISLLLEMLKQTLARYPELVVRPQDIRGVAHREELI